MTKTKTKRAKVRKAAKKTSVKRRKRVRKPSTKDQRPKTKKAAKRRKRAPLAEAQCRRLGYECADLLDADALLEAKPTLAKILARHPRLRKAFRRGQLLQQLRRLPAVTEYVTHAAIRLRKLGFEFGTGQDLRDFLDADGEALEVWNTAEANAWIVNRERLLATAADGNVKAIQLIDAWFAGREKESAPAPDLSHLSQQLVCELLGVTRQTVLAWENSEHLPRNADKSYNLRDLVKWYGDFSKLKASGPAPAADRMRDAKAEKLELQVSAQKGQLLDRGQVISGLVGRAEKLVGAFRYKRRELAMMLHGQTVEMIEECLGRFFDDLQNAMLEVPECLKLSAEAEQKFRELLEMISD